MSSAAGRRGKPAGALMGLIPRYLLSYDPDRTRVSELGACVDVYPYLYPLPLIIDPH